MADTQPQPIRPLDRDGLKLKSPFKAAFASYLINESLRKDLELIKLYQAEHKGSKETPKSFRDEEYKPTPVNLEDLKICIIGGGIAGLYTAYILERLGIDWEILEADNRVGGRLRTHYFSKRPEPPERSHDYYDVGAMRFPDTPVMERTFELFKELGMERGCLEKNADLVPYLMRGENQPTRYNDITAILPPKEKPQLNDPFKVSTKAKGPVPDQTVKDPDVILDDAYDHFRKKIKRAIEKNPQDVEEVKLAFDYLMRHDNFSLRDYLAAVEGLDFETVHWLETIGSGTGWFDQAFTENVLESLAFEYVNDDDRNTENYWRKKLGLPSIEEIEEKEELEAEVPKGKPGENVIMKNVNWWCVNGGTEEVVHRIKAKLRGEKIHCNSRVTKIQYIEDENDKSKKMEVRFLEKIGEDPDKFVEKSRRYSAVINSTTLAALQKMDLTDLDLPYAMKASIRSLRYDSSTKVGMKFKKQWWNTEFGIKKAGLGKTDMPLRICVYPSYNIEDKKEEEAVLLASYTWGQDAERLAAHVHGYQTTEPEKEVQLKELMFYNLARLHTVTILPKVLEIPKGMGEGEVEKLKKANKTAAAAAKKKNDEAFEANLKMIRDNYITHHAYDWSKDPHASGAFALFSPGQFSKMYPNLIRPACNSRFYIIGEAASAHHAWVVGALDSSVRALYFLLTKFGLTEQRGKMEVEFGNVDEFDDEVTGPLLKLGELSEGERKMMGFEVQEGLARVGSETEAFGKVID